MSDAVLVALITGGLMLAGNIIIALITNSKTIYRIEQLEKKMKEAAKMLEFEYAAILRDRLMELRKELK